MPNILPNPDEHAAFIGKTGSGKSYLAMRMLEHVASFGGYPIYILDSKGDIAKSKPKNSEIANNYNDVRSLKAPIRIWRPDDEEIMDDELLDKFLLDRYRETHCLTYIDELSEVLHGRDGGKGFRNLIARGRSRESSLWMSTQRPSGVTRYPFSESTNFYVFRLNDSQDRDRAAEFSHPMLRKPVKKLHQFWFYRSSLEDDTPRLLGPI